MDIGINGLADSITDVETFKDKEIEPENLLISPWLVENTINLIVGKRGLGKTRLGLWLVKVLLQKVLRITMTNKDSKDLQAKPKQE